MNTWIYNKLATIRTAGTETYPVKAKHTASLPYLVYSKVSTVPAPTKDGTSVLDEERWQFEIYHSSLIAAEVIATALRTLLDDVTDATNNVTRVWFEDSNQLAFDDGTDKFVIIQDYKIQVIR